ncbi:MAG: hypothetical protein ACI3ZZ_06910 [Candidatus Aphodosoma sp.]
MATTDERASDKQAWTIPREEKEDKVKTPVEKQTLLSTFLR